MEKNKSDSSNSRRNFLRKATATTLSFAGASLISPLSESVAAATIPSQSNAVPWYRRITRWGQTNITEMDPLIYDIEWWRGHWKRTQIQGVIINAGGIVAYYPTRIPFHYQARYLQGRDLFGDLCRAAHEDGLVVFARMDSNRAGEDLYRAHPDWFAINANGEPYRSRDQWGRNSVDNHYITCINSPYYREHIPSILTEISEMYKPEGFTDNSWSGLGRNSPCFCEYCQRDFFNNTGGQIPRTRNWNDPVYRQWIKWSYDKRLEIWDLNNRTTKAAGGPHCVWAGMNSGAISSQGSSFRDYKRICERADIIMLDHQARSDNSGFQNLADVGKIIHGMLGWDKLIPNSMAMYQAGRPVFRVSSKAPQEAHMWMLSGFAGGIQPWWHHIAAYHEDRRMYHTAEPILRWYTANEEHLINREPVATVGVVWSQENSDFYGRDDVENRVNLPWRGIVQTLIRGRIPYMAVHADHIDRDAAQINLLILPNVGRLTTSQVESIKRFVARGGSLFATGDSSLCDEWGDELQDYALSDLFKTHYIKDENLIRPGNTTLHSYLRIHPEMRKNVFGPQTGTEPEITGERHAIWKGFELTDIFPFGGILSPKRVDTGTQTLMTFIPEFPIFPPETAWMREPVTNIPGLIINTQPNGSRIAFMPADIDSQFARHNLPDHGDLLENIIRWAAKDELPILVTGPGLIDCHVFKQPGRLIIHLINLTSAATWRQTLDEYIPVGPVTVKVKIPEGVNGEFPNLMVTNQRIVANVSEGWCQFQVSSILNHELVVIT